MAAESAEQQAGEPTLETGLLEPLGAAVEGGDDGLPGVPVDDRGPGGLADDFAAVDA